MTIQINPLQLSYPNFTLGQIINPDEANQNNSDITNKVNEFITNVEDAVALGEDANLQSADALSKSNQALTNSQSALTSAESAVIISNEAKSIAESADVVADNAFIKATNVETDYNNIKPIIEQAVIDANNAVDSVASKASVEYVNNKSVETINYIINEIDRKEPVETEADLYIIYPDAEDGWICLVRSTRNHYVFNGATNQWEIRPDEINYADEIGNDGIITSEKFIEIKAINLKVDKEWGETYSATLLNGCTGNLYYRKNDLGECNIFGIVTAGTPLTAGTKMANIANGYIPSIITSLKTTHANNSTQYGIHISSSGNLYLSETFVTGNYNINDIYKI